MSGNHGHQQAAEFKGQLPIHAQIFQHAEQICMAALGIIEPPKALQDAKRSTSTPSQYDRSMSGSQQTWADFNWIRSRNLPRFSMARSHGFPSAAGFASSSPNRSTAPWQNKGRTHYNKYTVCDTLRNAIKARGHDHVFKMPRFGFGRWAEIRDAIYAIPNGRELCHTGAHHITKNKNGGHPLTRWGINGYGAI